MISNFKLGIINNSVLCFIDRERQREEDEELAYTDEEERMADRIGYLALRLSLTEETVARHWYKLLEKHS